MTRATVCPGDNRATLPEPKQDTIAEIVRSKPSFFHGYWPKVLRGGQEKRVACLGRCCWLIGFSERKATVTGGATVRGANHFISGIRMAEPGQEPRSGWNRKAGVIPRVPCAPMMPFILAC